MCLCRFGWEKGHKALLFCQANFRGFCGRVSPQRLVYSCQAVSGIDLTSETLGESESKCVEVGDKPGLFKAQLEQGSRRLTGFAFL